VLAVDLDQAQAAEIAQVFAFPAFKEANCINGATVAEEDGCLNFKFPLIPNTGVCVES